MIRILIFLAFVFLLGLGFAWLADRPGDMVVTFDGYQYRVSLMVAATAVTMIVAAVMIGWWLVKAIWTSPYMVARYFRVRRRDRGYQALSSGLIAAGAGDGALARRLNTQAAKMISADQEPMIHLLDAQASLLEGDHEAARKKFEAMLDDPETRLLGLRGLYLEAERLGDHRAARHYAGRAADVAPQLAWAAESTLEDRIAAGDWDGALRIADAQKGTRPAEKEAQTRRRAVLLTAKADALADTDVAGARAAALEANRLQPHFAPAALAAARALFRNNDTRRGAKILEVAWKAEPHPEIADLYVHARHGDAVNDRLNRARKLMSLKHNNAESAIAVARAALDAGDFPAAREAAQSAIRMQPREGAYLLMADIEEADGGDIGKVRELLAKAVRAPRDPAWVADGVEAEHWAPLSPVTGRLDAFEWRVPVERLGRIVEDAADAPALPPAHQDPKPAPAVVAQAALPANEPKQPESASTPTAANDQVPKAEGNAVVAAENAESKVQTSDVPNPLDVPPPLPDDPGVDPNAHAEASRRFKLF